VWFHIISIEFEFVYKYDYSIEYVTWSDTNSNGILGIAAMITDDLEHHLVAVSTSFVVTRFVIVSCRQCSTLMYSTLFHGSSVTANELLLLLY